MIQKLSQYKEIIHKCSKCGLCQEGCPIYQESGNECETARGLLIIIKGLISKEIQMKGSMNKYLDKCLRCGVCSNLCPSEIPVEDIIFAAKRQYLYSTIGGLFERFRQSRFFEQIFDKKDKLASEKFEKRVVYLGKNSQKVLKILNANMLEVVNPVELETGVSYVLTGNILRVRQHFKYILDYLLKNRFDFVVTDIPQNEFSKLFKTFLNYDVKFPIKYLGEFPDTEDLVCKYYNPDYTSRLLAKESDNL